MSTLVPAASACFPLTLPRTEKDDRFNLNVRTGSASTLYNSFVFTFGGWTIGLELPELNINDITLTFEAKVGNTKTRSLAAYLSGEFFYLSILDRTWCRLDFDHSKGFHPRPVPRAFHEICAINNCVYVFGGLRIKEVHKERKLVESLVPSNDLWEFNLATTKWTCLHDGSGWDKDASIPKPRFCHKMTPVNNLSFVNKKGHLGIFIAGGKDANSDYLYDNAIFDLVEQKYVSSTSGGSFYLKATSGDDEKDERVGLNQVVSTNDQKYISVDYADSVIVSYDHTIDSTVFRSSLNKSLDRVPRAGSQDAGRSSIHGQHEESIIVYTPTKNSNARVDKDDTASYQSSFKEPKNLGSAPVNPLVSFKLGKTMKNGKPLPLHIKRSNANRIGMAVPFNLRYPTGGLFGQNLVIVGFLPNDFDISVFVYNIPTGKWSRLNVFCNHEYGSHRFWGGFVWESHHKVVLIGNQHTSRTTSSIRYFTSMITISLPITNLLASWELANDYFASSSVEAVAVSKGLQVPAVSFSPHSGTSTSSSSEDEQGNDLTSDTDDSGDDENETANDTLVPGRPSRRLSTQGGEQPNKPGKNAITFADYIYYAAPKAKFSTIRSVFPPAAVTLGRNAFDRYGDLISDFEFVSANGDRIPVSTHILIDRWGSYFVNLLARGYIKAVYKFQQDSKASQDHLHASESPSSANYLKMEGNKQVPSLSSSQSSQSGSRQLTPEISIASNSPSKDVPQFRLPFQDSEQLKQSPLLDGSSQETASTRFHTLSQASAIDPHTVAVNHLTGDQGPLSAGSGSSAFVPDLNDIPAQLPLPMEPIPLIPATTSFKSASRKNSSNDMASPRNSIIHTLTTLRNIPMSNPKDSPHNSPRVSISVDPSETTLNEASVPAVPISASSSTSTTSTVDHSGILGKNELSAQGTSDESQSSPGSSASPGPGTQLKDAFTPRQEVCENPFVKGSDSNNILDASTMMDENGLLNFENLDPENFRMEASLIPRKLYIPFSTTTLRAFSEYLYTGQIGDKWLLTPTSLDCLALSKFFNVPLLYNLITETLFGIIGRKEGSSLTKWKKLKRKYIAFLHDHDIQIDPDYSFPFDEFEGFVDTVDDGYLDVVLLKKSSNYHKSSYSKHLITSLSEGSTGTRSNKQSVVSTNEGGSLALPDGNTDSPLDATDAAVDRQEDEDEEDFENELEDYHEETEIDLIESGIGYLDNHDTSFVSAKQKSLLRKNSNQQSALKPDDEESESNNDELKKQEDELEYARKQLLNITLAELVSPKSPLPSDYAIGLICEAAALVTDVKLMLRAMNARQMSKVYREEEIRLSKEMEGIIRRKYPDYTDDEVANAVHDAFTKTSRRRKSKDIEETSERPDMQRPNLRPILSQTSLTGKAPQPSGPLERSRTNIDNVKLHSLERTKSNNSMKNIFASMTPVKKSFLGETLSILNLGNALAGGYGSSSALYSPTGNPGHYPTKGGGKSFKQHAHVTTSTTGDKSGSKGTLAPSEVTLTVTGSSPVATPINMKHTPTFDSSPANSLNASATPPTKELSRSRTEPFALSKNDPIDDNHSIGGVSITSNATASGLPLRFFHLHRKDSNSSLETSSRKGEQDVDSEPEKSAAGRKKFSLFGRKK